MSKHAIKIESPHGRYLTTRVYLDGQELRGVKAAHVAITYEQDVLVTLTLRPASLILEGEASVDIVRRLTDEEPDHK